MEKLQMINYVEEIKYWRENYEKAMNELEKSQSYMMELSEKLRQLEKELLGGSSK
jgi:uncharacterized coiled-coil DUF342 family protein